MFGMKAAEAITPKQERFRKVVGSLFELAPAPYQLVLRNSLAPLLRQISDEQIDQFCDAAERMIRYVRNENAGSDAAANG